MPQLTQVQREILVGVLLGFLVLFMHRSFGY